MWGGCVFCYKLWEGLSEESGSYSAFIDEVCVCKNCRSTMALFSLVYK